MEMVVGSCCYSYNQKLIDEVPASFAISDVHNSPARMEFRVYVSFVISIMTYVSETRLVSLKERRIREELRMLVGVQPITTVIRSGI